MWSSVKKYLVAGLLTIIPIWVTWLALSFLFGLVIDMGRPVAEWLVRLAETVSPSIAGWIVKPAVRDIVAFLCVLIFLIFLGWVTARVLGRRLVGLFEGLILKIPLVKSIYGGSKKLIESFQKRPDEPRNVVLINYPSPEMKTVGFLMRTIIDKDTGRELAAVYVPTTPNPTSGFLEILPLENVTMTDWTVNDAISFVVSGATVGPDNVNFSKSFSKSLNNLDTGDKNGQDS